MQNELSNQIQTFKKAHWPMAAGPGFLDCSVGDFLKERAETFPERVAFIEGVPDFASRRRWTYRDLYQKSLQVAQALLTQFSPGERVAVWAPNSAEWVFLQHGAGLAGLTLVTVNPAFLSKELEYVLGASSASGLFHVDSYRGVDHKALANDVATRLPQLRHVISFSDWDSVLDNADLGCQMPTVKSDHIVQIQFTSGTTGRPKGACLHHRGVLNAARFSAERADFRNGGVWATAMPLFHVGGSFGSQLGAYSKGGTFLLVPVFEAGEMLEIIETEGVSHLHAVPTMVRAILDHSDRESRNLTKLRTIMSGGSPVPAALVREAREAFECRFTITFGQTELCGVVCQTHVDDEDEIQATTIGQPAPLMELKIANPDTGAVLDIGEFGEIWARGYQSMAGYFDLAEGSHTAITEDGWLRTGDQAAMDERGYLRITGRLKDCIIRGGENIYPREIEDVLEAHSLIQRVAVVAFPDKQWGEIVAAVIILDPTKPKPKPTELFQYCRSLLAAYKTPVRWYYVDQLPMTSSNKIKKQLLRDQIADGTLLAEDFVKPVRVRDV